MNAALYIHIPFCHRKCFYCDFYSEVAPEPQYGDFVAALCAEMKMYASIMPWQEITFETIYIGGGTPSVLSDKQIATILNSAHTNFHFTENLDITIEVNPESIKFEKLKSYKALGINRISIGVQSFHDDELKLLGRLHDATAARQAVHEARRAGFDDMSVDMIFGLPGQSLDVWRENLMSAIELDVQHLSMYGLTYEHGTKFDDWRRTGKIRAATDELEREMYLLAIETAETYGFEHYEISNFARPGFESRHNQKYWDGSPYLGLGPSAHSYWGVNRQWNVRSLNRYLKLIDQGKMPIDGAEQLDNSTQETEYIMLRLRTGRGIDLIDYQQRFGYEFGTRYAAALRRLESQLPALIKMNANLIRLTRDGFLLYDDICGEFSVSD
ncbi:radical SAM family heme chaperone HemW [candidate division KSB1 bacterium]|nr:radical SAM family heme chaperone HemW [candidate division KSB1 bacterium]